MLGLTWDCVDIFPESIEAGTAYIYINKEITEGQPECSGETGQERCCDHFSGDHIQNNDAAGSESTEDTDQQPENFPAKDSGGNAYGMEK